MRSPRRDAQLGGALALWAVAAGFKPVVGVLSNMGYRAGDPDPQSLVQAQLLPDLDSSGRAVAKLGESKKYLLASFPSLRQVAYCRLPDVVWRPLVLGGVEEPRAIAVDTQALRLFVSDPPKHVIWWFTLAMRADGLLETVGRRSAAVEDVDVEWLAVNGVGDLLFTGRMTAAPTHYLSIFRQSATNVAIGNSRGAVEIYSRSNTGSPDPKVWAPSGIAVDSLYVYWGNKQGGHAHGSIVKGSCTNTGVLSQDHRLKKLSTAMDEVRDITSTGTHIFYLAQDGVYGVLKSTATPVSEPGFGLIAAAPIGGDTNTPSWNPMSIAWDGENTLYFTEASTRAIYTLPSLNMMSHNMTKHCDAPSAYGVAVIGFSRWGGPPDEASARIRAGIGLWTLVSMATIARLAAGA